MAEGGATFMRYFPNILLIFLPQVRLVVVVVVVVVAVKSA